MISMIIHISLTRKHFFAELSERIAAYSLLLRVGFGDFSETVWHGCRLACYIGI